MAESPRGAHNWWILWIAPLPLYFHALAQLSRQLSGLDQIEDVIVSGAPSQSDRTFLRYFSMMIGAMALLLLCLLIFAWVINHNNPYVQAKDPSASTRMTQKLQPIGAVYSGDTGRAKMAAAKAAAAKLAASQVAYGGTTDGKTIYDHLCHSCHTNGVA
ncbi:MAG: hypothetical protein L0H70_02660, partial [Xanthomonadales bacterium]|nr:hypothetical protein [Xanthomonadales bacterium]